MTGPHRVAPRLRPLVLGLWLLAAWAAPARAQQRALAPSVASYLEELRAAPAARTPQARARRLLEDACLGMGCVGASVAVSKNGEIVFSTGFGFADLENRVPATGETVYSIGSVSKVMTAVAVMQLVERGAVGLDDDIRAYVPSFPDKGAVVTIRHLMTHTSGIHHYLATDFSDGLNGENVQRFDSYEDAIALFADDPLLFEPGAFYRYTSYGVNLLQGVVETASGQGFEDYLRAHVWEPAGMAHTSVDWPERLVPGRARSYRMVDGEPLNHPYEYVTYKFASGGMLSTVEDLVRFGAAFNQGRLVGSETLRAMIRPQLEEVYTFQGEGQAPRRESFRQALMWRIRDDGAFFQGKGRSYIMHGGSVRGFGTELVSYVEDDLVVAIAGNTYDVPSMAPLIANLFMDTPGG